MMLRDNICSEDLSGTLPAVVEGSQQNDHLHSVLHFSVDNISRMETGADTGVLPTQLLFCKNFFASGEMQTETSQCSPGAGF